MCLKQIFCLHLQNETINNDYNMSRKICVLVLQLLLCGVWVSAQEVQKSDLQQRAEAEDANGKVAAARSLYIHAFDDYMKKGQAKLGVECGAKATALYYRENMYHEAFELLRRIDQNIEADAQRPASVKAGLHYMTTRERMQMYIKMRRNESAKEQLNIMERQVGMAGDEALKNDLLYNKTIYYYTFGQNDKGDAVFKEMAEKLTAQREYDKVDQVYQTLIANGRRSNSASLVAQSYGSYMVWKDSVSALKHADEIKALKQQIADNEASIADKDSSLTARQVVIVGLSVLAIALAAVLVFGAFVLLRYMALTRKQKKTIRLANENNALKAQFISNISAQLAPTLEKLDSRIPEVKALQDFSKHIQTLSDLECTMDEGVELEEVQVLAFSENLMDEIRGKVKEGVSLKVNVPKMTAPINKEYVSHILSHLLHNAAQYTPEGGHISLDFKKRGPHTLQFLVSDTGQGIPEDKRDDVFKPFLEIRDLTQGDGLGLPICKQMAVKMKGDLDIDPEFTKGTRFVLELHS